MPYGPDAINSNMLQALAAAGISPDSLSSGAADMLLGPRPFSKPAATKPLPNFADIPAEKRTLWLSGSGNPLASADPEHALANALARGQLQGAIPPNPQNLGRGGQSPFAFNDLSAISHAPQAEADPQDSIPVAERVNRAALAAAASSRRPSDSGVSVVPHMNAEEMATGLVGHNRGGDLNPVHLANMMRQAQAAGMGQAAGPMVTPPGPRDAAALALPSIIAGGLSPQQQALGQKHLEYQQKMATKAAASHDYLVNRAQQKAVQRRGEIAGLSGPDAFYNAQASGLLNSLAQGGGSASGMMNPAIAGMLGGEGAFIAALQQGPRAQEMALQAQLSREQMGSHERIAKDANAVASANVKSTNDARVAAAGAKSAIPSDPTTQIMRGIPPDQVKRGLIASGKYDDPYARSAISEAYKAAMPGAFSYSALYSPWSHENVHRNNFIEKLKSEYGVSDADARKLFDQENKGK